MEVPGRLGKEFRLGPDDRIWTWTRNTLVRIDPQTLAIEPVGTLDSPGKIAFSGKDAYIGGTPQVRVVRGVVDK